MVAHLKRVKSKHPKRKKVPVAKAKEKLNNSKTLEIRPSFKDEEPPVDEEPRPEDLAQEEAAAKAAEVEEAERLARRAAADEAGGGVQPRDRSSYDGDTAIKLYLREIGQVKLLTPQEEIDL